MFRLESGIFAHSFETIVQDKADRMSLTTRTQYIPVIGYPPSSSGTAQVKLISSVTESSSGAETLEDNSILGRPGAEATPKDIRKKDQVLNLHFLRMYCEKKGTQVNPLFFKVA